MASFASLYEVLGIPMNATRQEIKVAYRNLALTCHPDVVATSQNDKSSHEFAKINIAYSTLSDPNKRVVYDREISKQRSKFRSFESIYATNMARGASVGVKAGYPRSSRPNWSSELGNGSVLVEICKYVIISPLVVISYTRQLLC